MSSITVEDWGDEGGIGGDEPFCEHGNLLWSEICDECIAASWKLTDAITAAAQDAAGER